MTTLAPSKMEWQEALEAAALARDWARFDELIGVLSGMPDDVGEEWGCEVFERLPPEIVRESDRVLKASLRGLTGQADVQA